MLPADEPLPVRGGLCHDQWRPARCGMARRQRTEHRRQRISGHPRGRPARFAGQRHIRFAGPGARVQAVKRTDVAGGRRFELGFHAGVWLSSCLCQRIKQRLGRPARRDEFCRAAATHPELHRCAASGNHPAVLSGEAAALKNKPGGAARMVKFHQQERRGVFDSPAQRGN